MKFICVTQRLIYDEKNQTFKDALDKELLNFLNIIGYIAIPIPNIKLKFKQIDDLLKFYIKDLKVKGFILSGGEDLKKNKERFKIEKCIYYFCLKNKIPLFGICRGLQMIAKINNINRDIASIREISPDGNGLVLVLSIFPSIFLSK